MNWNHRVVRMKDGADTYLCFREVYYNNAGEPTGHSDPFMHGESPEELKTLLDRLQRSLAREVLDDETDFDNNPDV